MMKINLVVQCLDYGDGVGNDVLAQQKMFQEMGYECDIYSTVSDESMKYKRKDRVTLKCESGDLLIHHYAGHDDRMDTIENQPCRKVFIYHNITPPEFVTGNVKLHCQMGLDQVPKLKGLYDAVVGDSQFNVECLKKLGMTDKGDVLPIPVEFGGTQKKKQIYSMTKGVRFLFVGRHVPNKKLEDIISSFAYYHDYIDRSAKLRLVGNPNVMQEYTDTLHQIVDSLDCCESIEFMGKVSDEKLQQIYADSDLFLCMSEHEGFCIPLLEAMWYQLPVFAFDAGAVRETMGNAGVVFTDKTPAVVAHMIAAVLDDKELLETIIQRQNQRIGDFSTEKVKKRLEELLPLWLGRGEPTIRKELQHSGEKELKIQLQGPFETSYSLAQVNRFLIEAMYKEDLANVSIHCTEGPGDYTPLPENLLDKPLAKFLWKREKSFGVPDVAIRNMFPPVTTGLTAQMNFQAFGWEEDRIPQEYVSWFNRDLDGIGTTSDFVTQALKDSGLTIPVRTMGNGVRLPANYKDLKPYPLKTRKTIKFLHISSAFPRKGVDVLLETYFEVFTAQDDVCLVLKTFPNIHNTSAMQLKELRKRYPHGPEVEHIDTDLPEEQLYGLYKAASCYVHCARGEGFGLPVAEAMLACVPVIACNNSGLLDFCTEETCLTVGFQKELAHSHLSENSSWFEPDRKQLKERLHDFASHRENLHLEERVQKAYDLISTRYTWAAVAHRWIEFIRDVQEEKRRPQVDMVSTWNNKCGIAEFTRYYVENSDRLVDYRIFPDIGHVLEREDEPFVQPRLWRQAWQNNDVDPLIRALLESPSQIVHIQYNVNFISPCALSRMCRELQHSKKVVIEFHATKPMEERMEKQDWGYVAEGLNCVHRLIVHQREDVETLKEYGASPAKIALIPLGQVSCSSYSKEEARRILGICSSHVVGSYGFLLPHKGIEKTIRAIAKLKEKYPDILYIASCALYDVDISREYYQRCQETIRKNGLEDNVLLFTDFLAPQESAILLQACDTTVMAYDPTGESASGAVRFCVAAKRPLITTKQDIFAEFADCSLQILNNEPDCIAAAIEKIFGEGTSQTTIQKMQAHIEKTRWHTVVKQILALYREALL